MVGYVIMQPELMLTMHLVGEYTLSFNFFMCLKMFIIKCRGENPGSNTYQIKPLRTSSLTSWKYNHQILLISVNLETQELVRGYS